MYDIKVYMILVNRAVTQTAQCEGIKLHYITFIHLADAFIQSDLQLLYMSEVARLWSNEGLKE